MTLRKGKKMKKINNGNDYGTTSQEDDLDSQLQRVSASAHEADIVQEVVPVYVSETTEQAKPKANTWSKVAAKRSSAKKKIHPLPRPDHLRQNMPLANFSQPNAPENKYSTSAALPSNAQWRILKHLRRNIAAFWSVA